MLLPVTQCEILLGGDYSRVTVDAVMQVKFYKVDVDNPQTQAISADNAISSVVSTSDSSFVCNLFLHCPVEPVQAGYYSSSRVGCSRLLCVLCSPLSSSTKMASKYRDSQVPTGKGSGAYCGPCRAGWYKSVTGSTHSHARLVQLQCNQVSAYVATCSCALPNT